MSELLSGDCCIQLRSPCPLTHGDLEQTGGAVEVWSPRSTTVTTSSAPQHSSRPRPASGRQASAAHQAAGEPPHTGKQPR